MLLLAKAFIDCRFRNLVWNLVGVCEATYVALQPWLWLRVRQDFKSCLLLHACLTYTGIVFDHGFNSTLTAQHSAEVSSRYHYVYHIAIREDTSSLVPEVLATLPVSATNPEE